MSDQSAVTYYGAPQLITVKYLISQQPGDEYPGENSIYLRIGRKIKYKNYKWCTTRSRSVLLSTTS